METKNNLGFDGPNDYAKVSSDLLRYTRKKLIDEQIWDYDRCTERGIDMVTDAIISYRDQIIKGTTIPNKRAYIKVIIDRILISKKFIKEKQIARQTTSVFNSSEEDIEKISFVKWIEENESIPEESVEEYSHRFFNVKQKYNNKFSITQLKIIKLKDEGYKNVEVSKTLDLSEGYVSKLVKKILEKITRPNWV